MLKAIGAMAGIETKLHSHLARHSFATYMLSKGTRIEHVGKMLGQTNVKTTQRYAKVLAQDIHDDFEKVAATMVAVTQRRTEKEEKPREKCEENV
jgi:site-specific recombinase XerD